MSKEYHIIFLDNHKKIVWRATISKTTAITEVRRTAIVNAERTVPKLLGVLGDKTINITEIEVIGNGTMYRKGAEWVWRDTISDNVKVVNTMTGRLGKNYK